MWSRVKTRRKDITRETLSEKLELLSKWKTFEYIGTYIAYMSRQLSPMKIIM
jgi:hypothetical protein